jgi:hypothetical protein
MPDTRTAVSADLAALSDADLFERAVDAIERRRVAEREGRGDCKAESDYENMVVLEYHRRGQPSVYRDAVMEVNRRRRERAEADRLRPLPGETGCPACGGTAQRRGSGCEACEGKGVIRG